jgi:hypothetical protein
MPRHDSQMAQDESRGLAGTSSVTVPTGERAVSRGKSRLQEAALTAVNVTVGRGRDLRVVNQAARPRANIVQHNPSSLSPLLSNSEPP